MNRAYVTLDGLRGVAALSIVVLHCYRYVGDMTWSSAALAVDLFFVLSGFVMAHAYEQKLAKGVMSPWQFIKARLIRFYPLYLLGLGLGVIEALVTIRTGAGSLEWSWGKLLTTLPFALFMLPTPGQSTLFPLNGVMWSIFFELFINVVWAVWYRFFAPTRNLLWVIGLSAVGLVISMIYWNTLFGLGTSQDRFVGGVFRVSYSFFLGLLLYRVHHARGLPNLPPVLLFAGLPAVLFLPLPPFGELLAALFVLPWFVLLGARVNPGQIIGWFCEQLGAASYALYTVHTRLYRLSYGALLAVGIDTQIYAPWIGIVFILGLIGLSLALEYYFHQPIRNCLTRRLKASQKVETIASKP